LVPVNGTNYLANARICHWARTAQTKLFITSSFPEFT
jgi:hypothetical protein